MLGSTHRELVVIFALVALSSECDAYGTYGSNRTLQRSVPRVSSRGKTIAHAEPFLPQCLSDRYVVEPLSLKTFYAEI